jgi:hypothetical protein
MTERTQKFLDSLDKDHREAVIRAVKAQISEEQESKKSEEEVSADSDIEKWAKTSESKN